MHKKIFTIFVGLFLLFAPIVLAQETMNKTSETMTEPAAYINYLEGDVFFQNLEKATIGMVPLQGDELITTKGRVEVYLRNGDFLRLDRNARVAFITLKGKTVLGIWSGSVYLRINTAIEVRTLHQSFILEMGLYRIDAGQKTEIYENPRIVDNFDSWNKGRENEINRPATVETRYGLYCDDSWRRLLLCRYLYGYGYWWHPFWPPISIWHSYDHHQRYDSYRQDYPQRTMIHVHKNQLMKGSPQNTVNRSTISPRSYLSRANTQFRPSPSPRISSRSFLSPSRSCSRQMFRPVQKSIKSIIRKK